MTWMAVAETAAVEDMMMMATCSLTVRCVSVSCWAIQEDARTVEGTGVKPPEDAPGWD